MREIKFRAWDGKTMTLGGDLFTWFNALQEDGLRGNHRVWNKQVFMQYTGLKDKNGKEIYEGDVILSHDTLCLDKRRKKDKQTVEWSVGYAGFIPFCEYDSDCGVFVDQDTVEVIGNIYENPELIK